MFRPKKIFGTLYSQSGQDIAVLPYLLKLSEMGINTLIDVGANHPIKYSNTLFFEKYLGMKTFAIEPLHEFLLPWNKYRPNASIVSCAISENDGEAKIKVPKNESNMFSSLTLQSSKGKVNERDWEERVVKTRRLQSILDENNIQRVALLSIDVEGYEMSALKSIDFKKSWFGVIIIENNSDMYFGSNEIRKYLKSKGYIFLMRIGSLDDVFIHADLSSIKL